MKDPMIYSFKGCRVEHTGLPNILPFFFDFSYIISAAHLS